MRLTRERLEEILVLYRSYGLESDSSWGFVRELLEHAAETINAKMYEESDTQYLRDQFAMEVFRVALSDNKTKYPVNYEPVDYEGQIARHVYKMADAMMAAREGKKV